VRLVLPILFVLGCGREEVPLDIDAACQRTECRVVASFGQLGGVGGSAAEIQTSLVWFGRLTDECGERVVELSIELVAGRGVFAGGLETGVFAIEGDELDPATCGACVQLVVDDGRCYFATSGRLVLTSVEVDMAGTLSDAGFRPIDCLTLAAQGSSCATAIDSISFNEPIDDDPD
jgi:hypothetical protein